MYCNTKDPDFWTRHWGSVRETARSFDDGPFDVSSRDGQRKYNLFREALAKRRKQREG